ncbi:MAG: dienelactone hydrolase [Marivirga sp.]|jgi:dienelactone hydrolase
MIRSKYFLLLILNAFGLIAFAQESPIVEKINLMPFVDSGVQVTVDCYKPIMSPKGVFVMFHQAGSSRGEYTEIAQKLAKQAYICYAVDLRSGKSINNVDNETYKAAKLLMKSTSYLDAYQDMETAMKHVLRLENDTAPIFIMGSSYSASLSIRLAATMDIPNLKAVLLFSPGEYFSNLNGDDHYVASFLKEVSKPIWVTSARSEASRITDLFSGKNNAIQFIPEEAGHHGAKALWSTFLSSEEYWQSMDSFYKSLP